MVASPLFLTFNYISRHILLCDAPNVKKLDTPKSCGSQSVNPLLVLFLRLPAKTNFLLGIRGSLHRKLVWSKIFTLL